LFSGARLGQWSWKAPFPDCVYYLLPHSVVFAVGAVDQRQGGAALAQGVGGGHAGTIAAAIP